MKVQVKFKSGRISEWDLRISYVPPFIHAQILNLIEDGTINWNMAKILHKAFMITWKKWITEGHPDIEVIMVG